MSQFAIAACLVLSLIIVGPSAAARVGGFEIMNRKLLYIEEESTERAVVNDNVLPDWLRGHVSSRDHGQGMPKGKLGPAALLKGTKALRTASRIDERVQGTTTLATVFPSPSTVVSIPSPPEPPASLPEKQEPSASAQDDPIEPKSAPAESPEMPPVEPASPDVIPVDSPTPPPVEGDDVGASPSEVTIDPAPPLHAEPLLEPQGMPSGASEVPPLESPPEVPPLESPPEVPPLESPPEVPPLESPPEAPEPSSPIISPIATPAPVPAQEPQSFISSGEEFPCGTSGECGEKSPEKGKTPLPGPASKDIPGPPKQLSSQSVEKSAVRIHQTDTTVAHKKRSSHIGHSVKVVSWTLAGICLVLVAIGNVLGIYYSRNRRRYRLLPTNDL